MHSVTLFSTSRDQTDRQRSRCHEGTWRVEVGALTEQHSLVKQVPDSPS